MPSLNLNKTAQICRWHSYDSVASLEQTAVAEILLAAKRAIDNRGAFHIVLSGGTTPRKAYEALRDAKAEWHAWHIYYGDERCLARGHEERNSHMAALAWLNHVSIPAAQIHPIPAEEGASIAAEKYALVVNKVKSFDLVLLGLGEDGHTASLFPEHDAGESPEALPTMFVLDAPKPPPQRVSLSARRLSDARQVMFLVTGNSKRQAVNNWRSGISIPATTITPANGVDIYIESALLV